MAFKKVLVLFFLVAILLPNAIAVHQQADYTVYLANRTFQPQYGVVDQELLHPTEDMHFLFSL